MPEKDDITVIMVNYKTPDLIYRAIWSFESQYPGINILIIDNNSCDKSKDTLKTLQSDISNLQVIFNKENIHHGPALDQGIKTIKTNWFITFDSDAILFRKGMIEGMKKNITQNTYAIGHAMKMNKNGFKEDSSVNTYTYIHPFCAMFNKNIYHYLTAFQKHGTPCLQNQIDAWYNGWELINFPVKDYVYHLWEGTAGKYGYNLGWKGKWNFIKNKMGL